jgi:hypothetical protein
MKDACRNAAEPQVKGSAIEVKMFVKALVITDGKVEVRWGKTYFSTNQSFIEAFMCKPREETSLEVDPHTLLEQQLLQRAHVQVRTSGRT